MFCKLVRGEDWTSVLIEPPREPPSCSFLPVREGDEEGEIASTEALSLTPRRSESSSKAGLLSRLLPFIPPILFVTSPSFFFGVLFLFRQVSKHSAQDGRPNKSTMGIFPMSLSQVSQRKQRLCQTEPPFSMKRPSFVEARTSLPQLAQLPLDPPLAAKQLLHKNLVVFPEIF